MNDEDFKIFYKMCYEISETELLLNLLFEKYLINRLYKKTTVLKNKKNHKLLQLFENSLKTQGIEDKNIQKAKDSISFFWKIRGSVLHGNFIELFIRMEFPLDFSEDGGKTYYPVKENSPLQIFNQELGLLMSHGIQQGFFFKITEQVKKIKEFLNLLFELHPTNIKLENHSAVYKFDKEINVYSRLFSESCFWELNLRINCQRLGIDIIKRGDNTNSSKSVDELLGDLKKYGFLNEKSQDFLNIQKAQNLRNRFVHFNISELLKYIHQKGSSQRHNVVLQLRNRKITDISKFNSNSLDENHDIQLFGYLIFLNASESLISYQKILRETSLILNNLK